MESFDIRNHIEFDSKGRAQCPSCLIAGKTGRNLSVQENGAYKCFRSCSPAEIRLALGQPKQVQSPPPKAPTKLLTEKQIEQAHQKLMSSKNALPWLLERGISREAIQHYKLGVGRAKVGAGHLPAITIPVEQEPGRYGQKKRIAPWLEGDHPAWSQYGISATVYSTHSPERPKQIWLCEGEWDAIALGWKVKHSELAETIHVACFTCGAGNIPPSMEIDRLPNLPIVTFYDLDEPGQKGAEKLQGRFKDRVRVATVPHSGEVKEGFDISDALRDGVGVEAIARAADEAKEWVEPKRENPLRQRLITNAELLARAPDHTEWLVPDLLTEDEMFILGAPPRGGKSFFCLTLAKAIATGSKFLERPTTQGSVIYVNCEDSEGKIKQREQAMDWPENAPVYWMDRFKLSELEYLKELAEEMPDLRLIILDTLSRVRDDSHKENSAELSRVLEPLQEFAKDRKICLLVTHHTGKLGEAEKLTDPFDVLRGNSAIRGTARGVMLIVPGDKCYRLLSENGSAENLDLKIRPDPLTCEWKLLGRWEPRIDADIKTQVLDHLNMVGQATVTTIAAELQLNARSVGTILSRLHADDLVSKVGGKGRSPAVYMRSFNLLQHVEAPIEACNQDREKDSALLQQPREYGESQPKVINGGKSDQCSDHFQETPPTHSYLLKQSQELEPETVPCFNRGEPALKQTEANGTETESAINYTPEIGQKVIYRGQNWQKQKAMGKKHLTISAVTQNDEGWWVTVTHDNLAVSQTIALSDVKVL